MAIYVSWDKLGEKKKPILYDVYNDNEQFSSFGAAELVDSRFKKRVAVTIFFQTRKLKLIYLQIKR